MAETISFSGASFTIGTVDTPGSNDVSVQELPGARYVISTEQGTPILNLGIQGDETDQFLTFTSETAVAVRGLIANVGGGDDVLVIGGKVKDNSLIRLQDGNDSFTSEDIVRDSTIRTNKGDDVTVISSPTDFVAVDSLFAMGKGDDALVFGGSVKNVEVSLGLGADLVEYKGNIDGSNLNLGGVDSTPDDQIDVIKIDGDSSIQGLVITGADVNDVLFIGSSEYSYDATNNLWVNDLDPSNTRDFS